MLRSPRFVVAVLSTLLTACAHRDLEPEPKLTPVVAEAYVDLAIFTASAIRGLPLTLNPSERAEAMRELFMRWPKEDLRWKLQVMQCPEVLATMRGEWSHADLQTREHIRAAWANQLGLEQGRVMAMAMHGLPKR